MIFLIWLQKLVNSGTWFLGCTIIAISLPEFGTNRSLKNPHIAPFGAVSWRRIKLYHAGEAKTPRFCPKKCCSHRQTPA
jgi:hypothetical protein